LPQDRANRPAVGGEGAEAAFGAPGGDPRLVDGRGAGVHPRDGPAIELGALRLERGDRLVDPGNIRRLHLRKFGIAVTLRVRLGAGEFTHEGDQAPLDGLQSPEGRRLGHHQFHGAERHIEFIERPDRLDLRVAMEEGMRKIS
jgi:hypothetical protein